MYIYIDILHIHTGRHVTSDFRKVAVYICIYLQLYRFIYIYSCICTHMVVCVFIRMRVHMCLHTHVYIHITQRMGWLRYEAARLVGATHRPRSEEIRVAGAQP